MSRQELNIEGRRAIEDRERQTAYLTAEVQRMREALESQMARHVRELADQQGFITVLQADRDALTRALEVCTRRLASPTADKDPSRGGWRSANLIGKDRGC